MAEEAVKAMLSSTAHIENMLAGYAERIAEDCKRKSGN